MVGKQAVLSLPGLPPSRGVAHIWPSMAAGRLVLATTPQRSLVSQSLRFHFPAPEWRVICMPDYLQAGEELTHAKFAAGLCRIPAYAARRAV